LHSGRFDSKAIIYGVSSFDETKTNLTINGGPHSGYHYYTDFSDPIHFDTAGGYYFDQAHLPCCYDHASGTSVFYYGESKLSFWPKIINEKKGETIYSNKYENIAKTNGIYISADSNPDESSEWYDCSIRWTEETPHGWQETYTDSGTYFYTGTGTLVVLDGNGETSKKTAPQIGIDDGTGAATAGDDIIEDDEWRPYPLPPTVPNGNGVIYSPGNIRILGIIDSDTTPRNLTIVSGGTIYIEGNIIKEKDSSSLALLAKDWVALNPTHKFTGGYFTGTLGYEVSGDEADARWIHDDKLLGEEDEQQAKYQVKEAGLETLMILDFEQMMTFNVITLLKLFLNQDWELSVWGSNNSEFNMPPGKEYGDIQFGSTIIPTIDIHNEDTDFVSDTGLTLRYVKIYLKDCSGGPGGGWTSPFQVDAIRLSLVGGEGGDGTYNGKPLINGLFYAQEQSWAVISGDETAVSPYAIVIGGCIAEKTQEESNNWSDWSETRPEPDPNPYIYYIYDSTISSNHLPSSVNLVSLKRK